ncbi:MAG: rhombosortase [Candidatus Thiodiazotropha sp.]
MRSACLWGVTLAALLAATGSQPLVSLLQYQRESIASGAVWQLFSGHLTHLGWGHLAMNLAGLWLIALMLLQNRRFWCLTALPWLMLGTSLGLWFGAPQVIWYQGLSGVLHGLLCWSLLQRITPAAGRRGTIDETGPSPGLSAGLLLLVLIKLIWEQWQGPLPGSESLARGRVIVEAHLYGALSGGILWGAEWIARGVRTET